MTSTFGRRQFGTFVGLLALCTLLTILTPHFLTISNLLNITEQTTINAVISVGMTFVILSGGIDLSVGSIVAVAGVCLATALQRHVPLPLALGVALGVGAACGLVNGLLITVGRLAPFIATLGMMSIARGIALIYTDGRPVSGFDAPFRALSTARPFMIPAPVILMLIVYVVAHLLLTRTTFGRYVYAIGGNEEATRLSGVRVGIHKTFIYVIAGLTSGIAAIILTARLNSAQPIAGFMYELDAIAATVIGGTSLLGGSGTLAGTLIGSLIMGVLRNGLNILGISSFLQQVVIGAVIIAAVLLDGILNARAQRARARRTSTPVPPPNVTTSV
jgi:ribose/xylose/arabinose/galactoside ABC-type transport system permease subunit